MFGGSITFQITQKKSLESTEMNKMQTQCGIGRGGSNLWATTRTIPDCNSDFAHGTFQSKGGLRNINLVK